MVRIRRAADVPLKVRIETRKLQDNGVEMEQNTFSPDHAPSVLGRRGVIGRTGLMSIFHKWLTNLQHRPESRPKYNENLRAEDGFVRASGRGFLRIY
jgi:hypothetical protein